MLLLSRAIILLLVILFGVAIATPTISFIAEDFSSCAESNDSECILQFAMKGVGDNYMQETQKYTTPFLLEIGNWVHGVKSIEGIGNKNSCTLQDFKLVIDFPPQQLVVRCLVHKLPYSDVISDAVLVGVSNENDDSVVMLPPLAHFNAQFQVTPITPEVCSNPNDFTTPCRVHLNWPVGAGVVSIRSTAPLTFLQCTIPQQFGPVLDTAGKIEELTMPSSNVGDDIKYNVHVYSLNYNVALPSPTSRTLAECIIDITKIKNTITPSIEMLKSDVVIFRDVTSDFLQLHNIDVSMDTDCEDQHSGICTLFYDVPILQDIATFNVHVDYFYSSLTAHPVFHSIITPPQPPINDNEESQPTTTPPIRYRYTQQWTKPIVVSPPDNTQLAEANTGINLVITGKFPRLQQAVLKITPTALTYLPHDFPIDVTIDDTLCKNPIVPFCRVIYRATNYIGHPFVARMREVPFFGVVDKFSCRGGMHYDMNQPNMLSVTPAHFKTTGGLSGSAALVNDTDINPVQCIIDYALAYDLNTPLVPIELIVFEQITEYPTGLVDIFVQQTASQQLQASQQTQQTQQRGSSIKRSISQRFSLSIFTLSTIDWKFHALPFVVNVDPICSDPYMPICTLTLVIAHNTTTLGLDNPTLTKQQKDEIIQNAYLREFSISLHDLRQPIVDYGEPHAFVDVEVINGGLLRLETHVEYISSYVAQKYDILTIRPQPIDKAVYLYDNYFESNITQANAIPQHEWFVQNHGFTYLNAADGDDMYLFDDEDEGEAGDVVEYKDIQIKITYRMSSTNKDLTHRPIQHDIYLLQYNGISVRQDSPTSLYTTQIGEIYYIPFFDMYPLHETCINANSAWCIMRFQNVMDPSISPAVAQQLEGVQVISFILEVPSSNIIDINWELSTTNTVQSVELLEPREIQKLINTTDEDGSPLQIMTTQINPMLRWKITVGHIEVGKVMDLYLTKRLGAKGLAKLDIVHYTAIKTIVLPKSYPIPPEIALCPIVDNGAAQSGDGGDNTTGGGGGGEGEEGQGQGFVLQTNGEGDGEGGDGTAADTITIVCPIEMPMDYYYTILPIEFIGDGRLYQHEDCNDISSIICTLEFSFFTNGLYPNMTLLSTPIDNLVDVFYHYQPQGCTGIMGSEYNPLVNLTAVQFTTQFNHMEYQNKIISTLTITTTAVDSIPGFVFNNQNPLRYDREVTDRIRCTLLGYKKSGKTYYHAPHVPMKMLGIDYTVSPYSIYPLPNQRRYATQWGAVQYGLLYTQAGDDCTTAYQGRVQCRTFFHANPTPQNPLTHAVQTIKKSDYLGSPLLKLAAYTGELNYYYPRCVLRKGPEYAESVYKDDNNNNNNLNIQEEEEEEKNKNEKEKEELNNIYVFTKDKNGNVIMNNNNNDNINQQQQQHDFNNLSSALPTFFKQLNDTQRRTYYNTILKVGHQMFEEEKQQQFVKHQQEQQAKQQQHASKHPLRQHMKKTYQKEQEFKPQDAPQLTAKQQHVMQNIYAKRTGHQFTVTDHLFDIHNIHQENNKEQQEELFSSSSYYLQQEDSGMPGGSFTDPSKEPFCAPYRGANNSETWGITEPWPGDIGCETYMWLDNSDNVHVMTPAYLINPYTQMLDLWGIYDAIWYVCDSMLFTDPATHRDVTILLFMDERWTTMKTIGFFDVQFTTGELENDTTRAIIGFFSPITNRYSYQLLPNPPLSMEILPYLPPEQQLDIMLKMSTPDRWPASPVVFGRIMEIQSQQYTYGAELAYVTYHFPQERIQRLTIHTALGSFVSKSQWLPCYNTTNGFTRTNTTENGNNNNNNNNNSGVNKEKEMGNGQILAWLKTDPNDPHISYLDIIPTEEEVQNGEQFGRTPSTNGGKIISSCTVNLLISRSYPIRSQNILHEAQIADDTFIYKTFWSYPTYRYDAEMRDLNGSKDIKRLTKTVSVLSGVSSSASSSSRSSPASGIAKTITRNNSSNNAFASVLTFDSIQTTMASSAISNINLYHGNGGLLVIALICITTTLMFVVSI